MGDIKTVDARGLSCPQPALQAKQAIKSLGSGTIEVLVDSKTSRDNVERLAQKADWSVTIEETSDGDYKLILKK